MDYQKMFLDWQDIEVLVKKIYNKISEAKIKIDIIVPILKGGFIPAMLIGKLLDNDNFACCQIRRSVSNKSNCDFHSPIVGGLTCADKILNSDVLIVEDIVYSGDTVKKAIEVLKQKGAKNIYIASLFNFYAKSDLGKIYCGNDNIKEINWIVFPWDFESYYCRENKND